MPNDDPRPDLRTPDITRGAQFSVEVDGREYTAYDGESVLGVLWANGVRNLHRTARTGEARGFFCAMGACFECLVTVNGVRNVRACLEAASPCMTIRTQQDPGSSHSKADHLAQR